jgi:putative Mg2+ transporter-C (MgtC) family protein
MNAGVGAQIVDALVDEFSDLADVAGLTRVTSRLLLALLLGAMIGWERERQESAAGLRTHMLVALGTALFVLVPQQAGMPLGELSRVLQGIVAGIGFLGAGAVLKLGQLRQIRGLTTAASIWATAAIGATVGLGREATALLATLMVLLVLSVLLRVERRFGPRAPHRRED